MSVSRLLYSFVPDTEDLLWLCLPILLIVRLPVDDDHDWQQPLLILGMNIAQCMVWQADATIYSGRIMAWTLLPSVCVAMSTWGATDAETAGRWCDYGMVLTWSHLVVDGTIYYRQAELSSFYHWIKVLVIALESFLLVYCTKWSLWPTMAVGVTFSIVWVRFASQFSFWTFGESQWALFWGLVGLSEWINACCRADSVTPSTLVALTGSVGCFVTVVGIHGFGRLLAPSNSSGSKVTMYIRWMGLVFGPLLILEVVLRAASPSITPKTTLWKNETLPTPRLLVPRCLEWLISFLQEPEDGGMGLCSSSHISACPRYYGLIYWVLCAGLLVLPTSWLYQAQSRSDKNSMGARSLVVMTRKWFHVVAIILFTPTSVYFPQLLSLSFAIALCVLMVLESIRHDISWIQTFYQTFQDPGKEQAESGILMSHVGLIVGCALPFWLSQREKPEAQATGGDHNHPVTQLLLGQWGIVSLGVGDAMGAVIGIWMGRRRWGQNNRTMEGSFAMWLSMMAWGFSVTACTQGRDTDRHSNLILLFRLGASCVMTTLLEAYTSQMDNLVLPLVGWVVWMSLEGCEWDDQSRDGRLLYAIGTSTPRWRYLGESEL